MHTRLFPTKDAYIENSSNYILKNFGRDELLEICAFKTNDTVYTSSLISESFVRDNINEAAIIDFSGILTGSLSGSVDFVTGSYSGSYSGSFTGSMIGFTGSVVNLTGIMSGTASGSYYVPTNSYVTLSTPIIKRGMLQFDLTQISESISAGDIINPKFSLNLKVIDAKSLPLTYTIYCYPLAKFWEMGNGTFADCGSDVGVNWAYTNFPDLGTAWYSPMNTKFVPTDDYLNTPSTSSFIRGGGVWHYTLPTASMDLQSGSSLMCSQSFEYYQKSDVCVDITNICKGWIGSGIYNNGVVVVSSEEIASNPSNGYIQFFSKETNTIYTPYIDVQWDDSIRLSGSALVSSSLQPVTSSVGVSVSIKNLKNEYKAGSIIRFDVYARDLYPQKTFQRLQTVYLVPKYLPELSYYSIKDNESEETIIDFDDYSKLSLDNTGNFFMVDTTGLPQERYYRLLVKSILDDGSVQIFDDGTVFKITR